MNENIAFLFQQWPSLRLRIAEHLELTGITLLLAFIVGVSLAALTMRHKMWRSFLLSVVSVLQTIPGIALLVMMMVLFDRIGTVPALSALFLYALLPIVQNTLVGLTSLSLTLAETAKGIGLTYLQRLLYIQLPLALPMMLAGLRTSAVLTVGLATLGAFIGAGGLGQFINRGLFLSDTKLILLGAIPTAILALLIHGLLGLLESATEPARPRMERYLCGLTALGMMTALATFTVSALVQDAPDGAKRVAIGSKNFTEQLIVAEMLAQQIERSTDIRVDRRFGLGGSPFLHKALEQGDIDLAVEYTGTALISILHLPVPSDLEKVFPIVRNAYDKQFQLRWLLPLGFDNSYILAVRNADKRLKSVYTITQLVSSAPGLTAAFDFEFAERDDGYQGLKKRYGLQFGKTVDMHPDLLYDALKKGTVDVISAYATDGRLQDSGLRTLDDDQHFFPPYKAAIVIREETLERYPELEQPLQALSNTLSTERMRRLNAAVDSKRMSVKKAAAKVLSNR